MMRVYLHIGFGKTGTTSIQDYLFQNRELRKADYIYPEIGRSGSGQHNLAILGKEEFSDHEHLLFSQLKDYFDGLNKNSNIIISSEFFCFMKKGYVDDVYKYVGDFDVRILFFVRKQIQLIQSTYLQWQREGLDYRGSIEGFFKAHARGFDFMERILPWAEIFGDSKIIARVFDNRLTNDVCLDFLNLTGIDTSKYKPLKNKSNQSILPEFSHFIAMIDRAKISKDERKEMIAHIKHLSKLYRGFSQYSLIDQDLADAINQYYQKSNRQFAERFLSEDLAKVFLA
jgi:hypothetical protein